MGQFQGSGCSEREILNLDKALDISEGALRAWLQIQSLRNSCLLLSLSLGQSMSLCPTAHGHPQGTGSVRSNASGQESNSDSFLYEKTPVSVPATETTTSLSTKECEYGHSGEESPRITPLQKKKSWLATVSSSTEHKGAKRPRLVAGLSRPQCSQCQLTFSNIGNLKKHTDRVHKKLGKIACEKCGKPLGDKWYAGVHSKTTCKAVAT